MTTPENRQDIPHGPRFDRGATQALYIADAYARKDNSDIRVRELYQGVSAQMGNFLLKEAFRRKDVNPKQLVKDLALLPFVGDGNTKPQWKGDSRLSPYALAVVKHAEYLAQSRENPADQIVNPLDLLKGIAVVAKKTVEKAFR